MHIAESSFIVGLEETELTTKCQFDYWIPTKTWDIYEKLEEISTFKTTEEINNGLRPGYDAAKFLYYAKDGIDQKPAFMRIYSQIPTLGTEWARPGVHATQAVPHMSFGESQSLKTLLQNGYSAVPRLLGYEEEVQRDSRTVPGEFTVRLVWKQVAGVTLSYEYFWGLPRDQRDVIREAFRYVYKKVAALVTVLVDDILTDQAEKS